VYSLIAQQNTYEWTLPERIAISNFYKFLMVSSTITSLLFHKPSALATELFAMLAIGKKSND
jgi:hypothetical protein